MNLREIKSLRKLNDHPNIVKLKEVFRTNNDLYFVFEYIKSDLYKVMKDGVDIKSIMYQILDGLKYIHKNGFFHRDLKPENILVSEGKAKIADFGLAREIRSKPPYTDYVSTRWYRAPELLFGSEYYTAAVDMWSIGCIFAELLTRTSFLPGTDTENQLELIIEMIGVPERKTIEKF
mmetsp:Transcript_15128/g.15000  ORF Transcript_15128/g.15000 Transcript_15128/m.15000 type:complete len:177 (+) Transcript_15128:131-661(+)